MQSRANVPKCPGMDEADLAGLKAAAKSKNQKKNEKRREKDKAAKSGEPTAAVAQPSQPTKQVNQPSQSAGPKNAPTGPSASASTATAAPAKEAPAEDPQTVMQKQIRSLNKKVRQCDSLFARQQAGEALTEQEQEKVRKMVAWQAEVTQLEAQLAKL